MLSSLWTSNGKYTTWNLARVPTIPTGPEGSKYRQIVGGSMRFLFLFVSSSIRVVDGGRPPYPCAFYRSLHA
jgi:hypothetical protein